jgi:hypothetical protein
MNMATLIQAVRQIQASDKRWIPEELQGNSFFGNTDLWEYFALGDLDNECQWCRGYAAQIFTGAQLRQVFPDLQIEGEDDIYPNVHMTLWGRETCKCVLVRVNQEAVHPEDVVVWTGENTPVYWKGEYNERLTK